jgi:hypothetical protein
MLAVSGAFFVVNCGSGLPHSNQVTASVTPASASVTAGGSVTLKGDAVGFTASPIVSWWIQEAKASGGDDCGYLTLPPTSSCEWGYVVFGTVTQFPSQATYYAPSTPGTYHVVFEATQNTAFDYLTKTVTATITVTQ